MSTPANPLASLTPEQINALALAALVAASKPPAPAATPWYRSPMFIHGLFAVAQIAAAVWVKNPQSQATVNKIESGLGPIIP